MSEQATMTNPAGAMKSAERRGDLRGRAAPSEIRFGSGTKIAALVAVVLVFGALAGYGYETGQFNVSKSPVPNSDLPTTSAPSQ